MGSRDISVSGAAIVTVPEADIAGTAGLSALAAEEAQSRNVDPAFNTGN
jgi:hypothetical protein